MVPSVIPVTPRAIRHGQIGDFPDQAAWARADLAPPGATASAGGGSWRRIGRRKGSGPERG